MAVAAGIDELQELLVRHVVDVDLECGHVDGEPRELVVPPERDLARTCAERGATGRHHDPRRPKASFRAGVVTQAGRRPLLLVRQLMPHVEHRFLVHRLVLEDRVDGLRVVQQRMAGLFERRVRERLQNACVTFVGEAPDLFARRPFGRLAAAGGCLAVRIDAAREQALEALVDTRPAERSLHERVEAERRKMALVEHDRVTKRDRPGVIRLGLDDVEEARRALAVPAVPVRERLAIYCRLNCGHECLRSKLE